MFYCYDLEGNLSSIADESGQEIVSYQHTAGGKLKTVLHQSGIRTDYGYDTAGNLTHLQTRTAAGGILCDLEYEYDLNGNRIAKTGTMALPDGSGQIRSQMRSIRYTYDSMSRLLSETEGGREDRYSYDLCGNRLEKVSGGERESCVYNSKNQLTERRNGSGNWSYVLDLQGNLLKESGPKETLRYEYNPRNQQSKVYSGERCIQENLYDGENLRAGMTEHGRRSTFLFMNREIVAELNASDTPESRFIRGYGAVTLEHNGKRYGIHHDEQLSIGWITGADGTVENAYEYDAFGNLLRSRGNVPNRLLYGGQQYDPEVGQYYLRARYYNPVVGRFTQEDPYRGEGLNLYAYCANNPVTYYDPSGYACSFNAQAEENAGRENATLQETKKSGLPEWLKELFDKGNRFNKENRKKYPYNEVELKGDKKNFVVDSYIPGKEIVSRKYTQFSDIKESTGIGYVNELAYKYSPGSVISDSPFNPNALKGSTLQGDMILEVPVQNNPTPQSVLNSATNKGITIRDVLGKEYN